MLHSKCKLSSLRSQCWMRLFLWFSNTVKFVFFVHKTWISFLLDEPNNLTNLTFCLNNLIGGQCVKNINLELLSTAVVLHLLVFYVPIHKRERLHNVWKSQKKSHSTWRAKRATFAFLAYKSSLKMPKIVNFDEFLKSWSLRSNSVTRQVNFNWTKIGRKCQIQKLKNAPFWIKHCEQI